MIDRYKAHRLKKVSIVSVNRELATLRRALHLAKEWRLIRATPKVKLLKNEPQRDFVLSREQETAYLAACETFPILKDVATLLIDTGLRVTEAASLQWKDVHLKPAGNARYAWVHIRDGKTKNAKRNVPLKARSLKMLEERHGNANASKDKVKSPWVFYGDSPTAPILGTSLAHMHATVRLENDFPAEFVLHSLRHTMLTRLGEAGADAFTIMKVAGHSSVVISQRYVHPAGETVQLAFDRLEALDRRALEA